MVTRPERSIGAIVEIKPCELQSIHLHLICRTGSNKVNAIKNLYLEESFQAVRYLTTLSKQLVENQDHQLNTDEAAKRPKADDNKAAVLLGLSYQSLLWSEVR